ncbi:methyltransferase domain-containing protein [bacterium]|nr:methyltransferase domain-containing protein [bacterium]
MDYAKHIDQMMAGYRNSMILAAACRTGLFAVLEQGGLPAVEVAGRLGLDPRATEIVLNALVAAGLLTLQGGDYVLEPGAAPLLLPDSPDTKASIIGHNATMMKSWIQLPEVLRTGKPAARPERTEQELRDFILGMENVSRASSREVLAKIDLGGARWLLDLGGGPGTAALNFAAAHPGLRCVVFDLPAPIGIAEEQITAAGLGDRVTTAAGDFLTDPLPTPPGGGLFDTIYISNIIHMLDEAQTGALLAKCLPVTAPGGRILLKDFFLEDSGTEPAMAAQFSVNMLVATEGGKSYKRSETVGLLRKAGFTVEEVVDVAVHSQVICARRES